MLIVITESTRTTIIKPAITTITAALVLVAVASWAEAAEALACKGAGNIWSNFLTGFLEDFGGYWGERKALDATQAEWSVTRLHVAMRSFLILVNDRNEGIWFEDQPGLDHSRSKMICASSGTRCP